MDEPVSDVDVVAPESRTAWLARFVLRHERLSMWWWVALSTLLGLGDYFTGPYVQFPVTFIIPVFLAAWYSGLGPALLLAVVLPLVRAAMMVMVWDQPWEATAFMTTAGLRIVVFAFHAVLISRLSENERALSREVELLEQILPICMYCKSIKNDAGSWETLERYISTRSTTRFTHGLCAGCAEKYYPDYWERKQGKSASDAS